MARGLGARLEEAVDKAFAAIFEPATWPDVLHAVARATDSTGAVAFLFGEHDRGAFLCSGGCTESMDVYLRTGWSACNPRLQKRPTFALVHDADFAGDDTTRKLQREFQEGFLRKHEMGFFVGTTLYQNDERQVLFSIERDFRHGAFDADELQLLERALARLRQAVCMVPKLDDAASKGLVDGFERVEHAAAILGENGAVLHMNRGAEEATRGALSLRRGRLHAKLDRSDHNLQTFIGGLTSHRSAYERAPTSALVVSAPDGAALIIRGAPLPAHGPDLFVRGRALLTFKEVGRKRLPDEHLIRDAFGLTAAEARLARAFLAAGDLRGAARANGIHYETARSHLRSVFAKTGTNAQAALATLLMSL